MAIEIHFSLTGERVVRVLQQLCEWHGKPNAMRSDNGPEFHSHVMHARAKSNDIEWPFTQPGCPAQNAYIERFNGTFRVEVLRFQVPNLGTLIQIGPLYDTRLAELSQPRIQAEGVASGSAISATLNPRSVT